MYKIYSQAGVLMHKKLYRSRTNRMIAGICGGIGEYFDVDPTLIRLIVAFTWLMGGIGVVVYLIGWLIIPLEQR